MYRNIHPSKKGMNLTPPKFHELTTVVPDWVERNGSTFHVHGQAFESVHHDLRGFQKQRYSVAGTGIHSESKQPPSADSSSSSSSSATSSRSRSSLPPPALAPPPAPPLPPGLLPPIRPPSGHVLAPRRERDLLRRTKTTTLRQELVLALATSD